MDCKTAQSLVIPYIQEELEEDQEEEFLRHIFSCRECYEELEIFYTVFYAMQKLDTDEQVSYDMRSMLEDNLKIEERRIIRRKLIHYFSYAVMFAAEVLLALMLLSRPAAINFFRVPAETEASTETESEGTESEGKQSAEAKARRNGEQK